MGPLDRTAFRVIVSLALHGTLALVAGIAAGVLAPQHPAIAGLLATVALVNGALGLRLHLRLMNYEQRV